MLYRLLTFILYLDRICISQATSSIENDLHITHTAMGFVHAAFTVAYAFFEVPVGRWGDRHGSRGVLTRIVLCWSLFTVLTGRLPPVCSCYSSCGFSLVPARPGRCRMRLAWLAGGSPPTHADRHRVSSSLRHWSAAPWPRW